MNYIDKRSNIYIYTDSEALKESMCLQVEFESEFIVICNSGKKIDTDVCLLLEKIINLELSLQRR